MDEWRKDFELLERNEFIGNANDEEVNKYRDFCNCHESGDSCLSRQCYNYERMIECHNGICRAPKCGNRRIQFNKERSEAVEVRPAGPKGWGLFTTRYIRKDDYIGEFLGEIISEDEHLTRMKRRTTAGHAFIVQLKPKTFLDCSRKGSIVRFINHSCEPNCITEIWNVKNHLRIGAFATTDLPPDTELSFDYRWERSNKPPTKCHCGTATCRGFLEVDIIPPKNTSELRQGVWKSKGEFYIQHRAEGVAAAGEWLVDKQIKVWWEGNQSYFVADVLGFNSESAMHEIQYLNEDRRSREFLMREFIPEALSEAVEENLWLYLDETEEELLIKKRQSSRSLQDGAVDSVETPFAPGGSSEERVVDAVVAESARAPPAARVQRILSMDVIEYLIAHFYRERSNGGEGPQSSVTMKIRVVLSRGGALVRVLPGASEQERRVTLEGSKEAVQVACACMDEAASALEASRQNSHSAYLNSLQTIQTNCITTDWRCFLGAEASTVEINTPGWANLSRMPDSIRSSFASQKKSSIDKEVALLAKAIRFVVTSLSAEALASSHSSLTLHAITLAIRFIMTSPDSVIADAVSFSTAFIMLAMKAKGHFRPKYLFPIISASYQAVFERSAQLTASDPYVEGCIKTSVAKETAILKQLCYDLYVPDVMALIDLELSRAPESQASKLLLDQLHRCICCLAIQHTTWWISVPTEIAILASTWVFLYILTEVIEGDLLLNVITAVSRAASVYFRVQASLLAALGKEIIEMVSSTHLNTWVREISATTASVTLSSFERWCNKWAQSLNGDHPSMSLESLRRVNMRWLTSLLQPSRATSPVQESIAGAIIGSSKSSLFGLRAIHKTVWSGAMNPSILQSIDVGKPQLNSTTFSVSLKLWPLHKNKHHEEKKDVAANITAPSGSGFSSSALLELQILQHLHYILPQEHQVSHLFITPYAVSSTGTDTFLLTNHLLCDLTSVLPKLHSSQALNPIGILHLREYCRDLMQAIQHCVRCGIYFNWILKEDLHILPSGSLCLAGLQGAEMTSFMYKSSTPEVFSSQKSKKAPEPRKPYVQKIQCFDTAAPEILLGASASAASTIWSAAMNCIYILSGIHVYKACPLDPIKHMQYMYRVFGTPRKMGWDMKLFNTLPMAVEFGALLKADNGEYTDSRSRAEKVIPNILPDKVLNQFEKPHAPDHSSTTSKSDDSYSACGVVDYFMQCLRLVPVQRIISEDMLNHTFFGAEVGTPPSAKEREEYALVFRSSKSLHGVKRMRDEVD